MCISCVLFLWLERWMDVLQVDGSSIFFIRTKTGRSKHQMVVDDVIKAAEYDGMIWLLEFSQRKMRQLTIHIFLKSMSEKRFLLHKQFKFFWFVDRVVLWDLHAWLSISRDLDHPIRRKETRKLLLFVYNMSQIGFEL